MKTIVEEKREIPVVSEVDVLVLGSGPAGFGAAISAGRQGAKTMIVEQFGDIGGVSTTGLMSHWTGRCDSGLYNEILDRTMAVRPDFEIKVNKGKTYINPEELKNLYIDMLQEAGVEILLYTMACEAIVENDVIKGVIVENKSGRTAILAKVVIDCTGDGDIAARAGVPFYKGRESDHKMQPLTLMFKVGGVDLDRAVFPGSFESNIEIPAGKIQDLAKEHIPHPAGHALLYKASLPGVVTCNMTNIINVDATDAKQLSDAHIKCRKQMKPIVEFLHKFVPGFEECYIISAGSLIGIRETRHFEGEKTLQAEDILTAKVFDDWVVSGAWFNFDVHSLSGAGLDETGCQHGYQQNKGYTIPYGCLVPKKIDNLLLAGRNISGTHLAHSNYRVMPICVDMGLAAGIAAKLAIDSGITVREVNAKDIQNIVLDKYNCVHPEEL
ncbi:MAG: FAD-dependent oxidoreductase [Kiritimatiellae bacterium]|jgi:hypothetical protein|nr:FAD-dependent oxidoreductase [Kiritimatiellia bacterium]